ncbi:histidine kinase [Cytobacillus firmus]|uniref:Histidine kinase n=2 Tax=Cytobacillus TaxID=2675230 RepID=A0A366JWZ0_CYTFI|nr:MULTISPECIES: histidine kinase [Cytobacillus]RBP93215.1 histidine kinase [Cytobacillus firmus]TDX42817.1 histidine kinase [Cytobacillus oceanisediminis]
MLPIESFSIYIMFCVLVPLAGAFTLLFLFVFEKRIDLLEKQKREIALESELQTALYNQLNQEIQPHFFFNTLNSILALARLDRKEELIRSIETLSKLLKFKYRTLNNFISIEDELTYVNYYLEIQKTRFRDRLHYEIQLDSHVNKAIIIPFLIQTIVENAFKHAFERHIGEALLKIQIIKIESAIHVSVWNNSLERYETSPLDGGVGLENIKRRLELLFPNDETSVQLTDQADGTTVLAIFPHVIMSEKLEGDWMQ